MGELIKAHFRSLSTVGKALFAVLFPVFAVLVAYRMVSRALAAFAGPSKAEAEIRDQVNELSEKLGQDAAATEVDISWHNERIAEIEDENKKKLSEAQNESPSDFFNRRDQSSRK